VREFLTNNRTFLFFTLFWVLAGMFAGPVVYAVVPFVLYYFFQRKWIAEILMGFILMLVLSDSRSYTFGFAQDAKNVYIVMMAIFYFMDSNLSTPLNRIFKAFIPFLLIAAMFMVTSDYIGTTVQKTISYALLLLVVPNYFLQMIRDEGKEGLRKFLWWITLLLLIGFVMRFVMPGYVTLAGRYTGLMGNPNGLGLFCLLFFMVVAVASDVVKNLFSRRELIIIYSAIFLSMVLCGSRNAIFTIVLFLFFRQFYILSPFIGFIMFVVVLFVYQYINNNIEGIIYVLDLQEYFRIETLRSGSGRLVAWEFGWSKIQEGVFSGGGIGYTEVLYKKNYEMLSIMGHQGNAHNSYITFWLDTGIVGVLSYVIGMIVTFIRGARAIPGAIPAMYGILFSAFFESWLTASLNPLTIQAVIIMTMVSIPEVRELFGTEDTEPKEEIDDSVFPVVS
jgi:O-antigen ligase